MTLAVVEAKRAKDRERHRAMTPAQRAQRLKAQRGNDTATCLLKVVKRNDREIWRGKKTSAG
jgi:hypothetical protein